MKKLNILLLVGLVILTAILNTACGLTKSKTDTSSDNKELHVAAASDLRFAFEELGKLFEEETRTKVVFQFGSTGNLANQIANGAPIDLFASANKKFVEDLVKSGDIIEDTVELYAVGRIVLAVNKKSNLQVTTLEDLLKVDIENVAIANPQHAPYGLAAKEALEKAGLWESLEDKLVYGENVSQTMQFIQTGNAPVGIIALSIANVEELEFTLIDESLHNRLEQVLGVIKYSKNQESAKAFAKFVNSPKGRIIMEKYGFYIP